MGKNVVLMTIEDTTRTALVVILATVLIAAPVAGATGAGVAGSMATAGSNDAVYESDQFIDVSDNVTVWERAGLPLRADADAGATVVDNHRVFVRDADGRERDINRDQLAVYDTGTVPVSLSTVTPGADTTKFEGEEVQVLVAHSDQNPLVSPDVGMLSELVDGNTSAADEQALNDNATFSLETATVDSDGTFSVDVDAQDPGSYSVVAATGNLFKVNDGDIQLPEDMAGTVIGAELFAVQSDASSVDAPNSVEPGDNVTFDVDADLEHDNVSHVVALYDEETLSSTRTNLNLTDEVTADLTADDLIVEHQIAEVNGVADLDQNLSSDVATERGTVGLANLVSTVTTGTPIEGAETRQLDDPAVLNASVIGVADADSEAELTVETFGNWTEGEYRYVHLAVAPNETQSFATATGTVDIETDDGGGVTPPPGPGPSPDPDPDPTPEFVEVPTNPIDKDSQRAIREGVGPGTTVTIPLSPTTAGQSSGYTFDRFNFTVKQTDVADVDLTFTQRATRPSDVKPVPTADGGRTFMQVDHPAELGEQVEDVTFDVTVSRDKLEKDNRDVEDVQFYRYDGKEWALIDAEVTAETDTTVTFTVDSPGLSVFAPAYTSADISVDGASLSETEIQAGNSVDVDVTLKNTGSAEGTYSVPLTVDGSTVDTQEVTIPGGEKASITFTRTFEEAGEYEIAADGTVAGTLTVTDDSGTGGEDPGTGEEEPSDGGGLLKWIFGIIVIAVVGSVVFLWRTGRLESMLDDLE